MNKSSIISRRMGRIGSFGKIIHLLLHIWEEFGNAKFELPGQYLMPCLRLIHAV